MQIKELLPSQVQKVLNALLSAKGKTPIALRQSIEAYGEKTAGVDTEPGEIPADLTAYLDKVSHYAYQVTGEDINRLRLAGYSEDEIFEITASVAIGAGLGRLKRGLMALKGSDQA